MSSFNTVNRFPTEDPRFVPQNVSGTPPVHNRGHPGFYTSPDEGEKPREKEKPRSTPAAWVHHVMSTRAASPMGQQRESLTNHLKGKEMTRAVGGMIPKRMKATLCYGDGLSQSGAGFYFQNYRANSVFDPDHTGTGTQPVGFDQWMAFYANFIVTSVRITLVTQSSGNERLRAYIWPALSSGGGQTENTVLGQPRLTYGAYCGTGCPPLKLKMELNINEILGLTLDEMRAVEECWGSASANPTRVVYLNTLHTHAALTGNIVCLPAFRLEYGVEFFNPVQLSSS